MKPKKEFNFMAITAALVKELRERTGAGMMECKNFLVETNGDIDKAIEAMRKQGVMKAAKREGKITAEGIILMQVSSDKRYAVIVEVNCETDFVARGDDFKQFAQLIAERALAIKANDVNSVLNAVVSDDNPTTIETIRTQLVAKIGENINLRRIHLMIAEGQVGSYSHGDRIGVLVDIVGGDEALCKDIAMHIAASNPIVVAAADVPKELIEKEKEIYSAQAADSKKPAEIVEKMVAGRIKKFLDEVSLHGQPFVKDPSTTVSAVLKNKNADVKSFIRFEVGEGIEKKQTDFAKEVMEQVQGN